MRSLIALTLIFVVGFSLSIAYAQLESGDFGLTDEQIDFLNEQDAIITANAEQALALIELANSEGVNIGSGSGAKLIVTSMHQGSSPNSASLETSSFLQYCLTFIDGVDCGNTIDLRSRITSFDRLTFVQESNPLRTLIGAEVTGVTDYKNLGTNFCHADPSWAFTNDIIVNGVSIPFIKQFNGVNNFDLQKIQFFKSGLKFTPELVESILKQKGVVLTSGDKVSWIVNGEVRNTIFQGEVFKDIRGDLECTVTSSTSYEAYSNGHQFRMDFVYFDPFDLIQRPTTTLPDTDGDGIPDRDDECSFSRETFNDFEDEDGCPDAMISPDLPFALQDADGDGFINSEDDCTFLPENFNNFQDEDGCPDGQSIENIHVQIGDTVIELTGQVSDIPDIITIQELFEQSNVELTDQQLETIESQTTTEEELEEIEEDIDETNEETNEEDSDFHSDEVMVSGNQGTPTQVCNNLLTDCNREISVAIELVQMTTGIPIPFQPTLLNLVIFFAVITVIILVVIKFVVGRKK